MSKLARKTCDECGRSMAKATRIENNAAYCSTCYARQFKPVSCITCQKTQRIHIHTDQFNCRYCKNRAENCARCRKPTHGKIGCRIANKPICNSCAVYFKPDKADTEPTLSPNLSKAVKATCKRCGKHREIKSINLDGDGLCKDCIPGSEVSHQCPVCNIEVAGSGNSMCRLCGIVARGKKRAEFNKELFEQAWCQTLFVEFIDNILSTTSNGRIASVVDRYALAFQKIEHHAQSTGDLSQALLFKLFGGEGLRTHTAMINYFIQTIGLSWSAEKLEELIEFNRIKLKLAELTHEPWYQLIDDYLTHLKDETHASKKLQPKTIRTYLNAGIKFLSQPNMAHHTELTPQHFAAYTSINKGQYASLTPFCRFIGIEQSAKPKNYPKQRLLTKDSEEVVNFCSALLQTLNQKDLTQGKRKAVVCALLHSLYDISVSHILKAKVSEFNQQTNTLVVNNFTIQLDKKLGLQVYELSSSALNVNSEYIFYGKNTKNCMSTATYNYYATAIFESKIGQPLFRLI